MADDDRVRVETDGDVVRLVLARPSAHNVVDFAFCDQFLAAASGPARSARCVEVVAEGANFCVGGDVNAFRANPGGISDLADAMHAGERALLDLEVPVIVGVNGWAAGIGLSLVLTGDLIVMGASARLRPAYTAIGLSPDGGMTALLPAAVGRARAMDMFLTNRPMDATEALGAGLAARMVEDAELRASCDELAAQIAAGPTGALKATKKLVRAADGRLTDAHLDAEAASIGACGAGPEGREGVASFVEKRRPEWPRD
jgi:2-(1,2-epoxy-1,2-dihydrophenyl)acetyl-CoA isomerase